MNLKLNRDKCELGVKRLTLVGDVVSEEGVEPDPRKMSVIVNMDRPKNKEMLSGYGNVFSQVRSNVVHAISTAQMSFRAEK